MGLLRPHKKLVNSSTNTMANTMTTEELLAPLASMEDLSVLMTPMSTPGPSPRTRARWSHRSSSGSQYEPYVASPLTNNNSSGMVPPIPRKGPAGPSLLRQSLENGGHQAQQILPNRFVTPYKHDPADWSQQSTSQVTFRKERNLGFNNSRRTYPSIDEAEEFLLDPEHVNNTEVTSGTTVLLLKGSSASAHNNSQNYKTSSDTRQVQFLTPRRHNHHAHCAFNDLELSKKSKSMDLHEDRVRHRPEPKDR